MTESQQEIPNNRPHALITGAHGMLGRFLCNQFSEKYNVTTLGLNQHNDIVCDLSSETPQLPDIDFSVVVHAAGITHDKNAYNINTAITKNLCQSLSNKGINPDIVFISSAAIYGLNRGENITEEFPSKPSDSYGKSKLACEEILATWCNQHNVTLSILRPPMILGTGMKGTLRRMVNGLNDGYYFNIKGNTAQRSIVHAKDVAKAAFLISSIGGIYNITDRIDPSVVELANALAHRINGKRVYSLPKWIVKFLLPKHLFEKLTNTLTFNCDKLCDTIDFKPENVVRYLLTHQYDENDI